LIYVNGYFILIFLHKDSLEMKRFYSHVATSLFVLLYISSPSVAFGGKSPSVAFGKLNLCTDTAPTGYVLTKVTNSSSCSGGKNYSFITAYDGVTACSWSQTPGAGYVVTDVLNAGRTCSKLGPYSGDIYTKKYKWKKVLNKDSIDACSWSQTPGAGYVVTDVVDAGRTCSKLGPYSLDIHTKKYKWKKVLNKDSIDACSWSPTPGAGYVISDVLDAGRDCLYDGPISTINDRSRINNSSTDFNFTSDDSNDINIGSSRTRRYRWKRVSDGVKACSWSRTPGAGYVVSEVLDAQRDCSKLGPYSGENNTIKYKWSQIRDGVLACSWSPTPGAGYVVTDVLDARRACLYGGPISTINDRSRINNNSSSTGFNITSNDINDINIGSQRTRRYRWKRVSNGIKACSWSPTPGAGYVVTDVLDAQRACSKLGPYSGELHTERYQWEEKI
jgi:hypothetical protein